METLIEKSLALHGAGSNCAQSVLCAFADDYGFDGVVAHRLATALGAGLGRRQLLCGAVSGGAMAIGAALGNDTGADPAAKERCYAIVASFVATVEAEFGSSDCRTLLGVDLNTAEGKAAVKAQGLGASVCDRIIARSTELVAAIVSAAKA